MNIIKKTKEHTTKLSISGKIKKCYRLYCMVVVIATLIFGASVTAFAANDPIVVINNLSGFIFGLIRAVGLILLGFLLSRTRQHMIWHPLVRTIFLFGMTRIWI